MIRRGERRKIVGTAYGILVVLPIAGTAQAEGSDQLGQTQALRAGTTLRVDVLDADEVITWTGRGDVDVRGPSGQQLATVASGAEIAASEGVGTYSLTLALDQQRGSTWDVSVNDVAQDVGRLSSFNWMFNAGSFAESAETNSSFFALVDAGDANDTAVIELKLEGLAGYIYDVNANRKGVDGPLAGRSVPESGNSVTPEYPIYLNVPEVATFGTSSPSISEFSYVGGVDIDVSGEAMTPCEMILPGQSRGYFSFSSQTSGSYHLQCDLDRDGEFSLSSGEDLLLLGSASSGENTVPWDGVHNDVPIESGSYQCRIQIAVGEFHYVGRDIETSYPGLRLFQVQADGSREGLSLYWNDSLIQSAAIDMPNGDVGLVSSEGVVSSGGYESAVVPNENAHSWGDFSGKGKGNINYVDTYTWLDETTSSLIELTAADGMDSDGDGLSDYEESCLVGSDPASTDSDNDGTLDGEQYSVPLSTAFSGLESNGRMATALARRAIRGLRMSVPPTTPQYTITSSVPVEELEAWLPDAVDDASAVSNTPPDLIGLTNADTVVAADYVTESGERRGGALYIAVDGAFYEHQKNVCDRVRGARLLDVRPVELRGVTTFMTTLNDSDQGRFEYAVSLAFWLDPDSGAWVPTAFWTSEDAPGVSEDATTVMLQTWGASPKFALELMEANLETMSDQLLIEWPDRGQPKDDAEYASDELGELSDPKAVPPSVWVESFTTLGGKLDLSIKRASGAGDVDIRFTSLEEDAKTTSVVERSAPAHVRAESNQFALGSFLETTAEIYDDGKLVDRVWISDGTWAPYDEGLWQGESSKAEFSRSACRNDSAEGSEFLSQKELSKSDLVLSGCARAAYSGKSGSAGVVRQLMKPLRATDFESLVFHATIDVDYQVCLEGPSVRECVNFPARPEGAWEGVPTRAFRDAAAEFELLTFTSNRDDFEIEIAGVRFLENHSVDTRPPLNEERGCNWSANEVGGSTSRFWLVLLAVAACAWARRRSNWERTREGR